MAWTQAEIDALKAAIATGIRAVQYADKTVTYQSIESMVAALAAMQADVAGDAGSGGRTTYAAHGRG